MATVFPALFVFVAAVVDSGSPGVEVLFFTAPGCAPCQQMQAPVQKLASLGVAVHAIDCAKQRDLALGYKVQNLPTLVILGGGQEYDRIVGAVDGREVQQRVARIANRFGVELAEQAPALPSQFSDRSQRSETVSSPVAQAGQTGPIIRGQSPGGFAPNLSRMNDLVAQRKSTTTREMPTALLASHQNQANSDSTTPGEAIRRAAAATVRIQVEEANTTAHGTGTIIDVHNQEALVLTCGHLFREMQPGSELSVDLFAGTPQEVRIQAQLIDFQAEKEDIGLISFRLPVSLEPVPLLPQGQQLEISQPAFSFGCDHGANPTRRDTKITNINRYLGPENIEIAGAPAVGRSGGGLFDLQGRLIGVCNAADATGDEGIYASASVIFDQLARLGLQRLYTNSSDPADELPRATLSSSSFQSDERQLSTLASGIPQPDTNTGAWQVPRSSDVKQRDASVTDDRQVTQNEDIKLLVIVREPGGRDRMVQINQPSSSLLERIHSEAGSN